MSEAGLSPVGIFHGVKANWWAYKNPRDAHGPLGELDGRDPEDSFSDESSAQAAQRKANDNPSLYHECTPSGTGLPASRCLGGWNSTCADGYRGQLCAICVSDWYRAGRSCEPWWRAQSQTRALGPPAQ